jgi:molybdopterin biosynthesis enzyme
LPRSVPDADRSVIYEFAMDRITPVVETETVVLSAGRGRVVASNVEAPVNMRHFDNSAVDGYETTKRARC